MEEEQKKIIQEEVARLMANKPEQPTTVVQAMGPMVTISKFSGSSSSSVTLRDYFRAIRTASQLYGWSEAFKLNTAKAYLEGPAARHIDQLNPTTFQKLKEGLKDRFQEKIGLSQCLEMLSEQKQRSNEDVSAFWDRLQGLRKICEQALKTAGLADPSDFLENSLFCYEIHLVKVY